MLSERLFHMLGDFIMLRPFLVLLFRRWDTVNGASLADTLVAVTKDQPNVFIRADVHTWLLERETPYFGILEKNNSTQIKKETKNISQNITKP